MRISDWSSDVCSSDLGQGSGCCRWPPGSGSRPPPRRGRWREKCRCRRRGFAARGARLRRGGRARCRRRSEEHTYELQSIMRISYAVFCLKKKKEQTTTTHTPGDHTKETVIKTNNIRDVE